MGYGIVSSYRVGWDVYMGDRMGWVHGDFFSFPSKFFTTYF